MPWTVEFAFEAEHDLSMIFDHLFETYTNLGDLEDIAFEHAAERIRGIQESANALASNPFRGTKRDAIGPNVRNITINRAVIWFQIDEPEKAVRVLAFFFGGEDHTRHMLRRLLDR